MVASSGTYSTHTHFGPFPVRSDGAQITEVNQHPHDPDPAIIGQGLKAATELRVARPESDGTVAVDGYILARQNRLGGFYSA